EEHDIDVLELPARLRDPAALPHIARYRKMLRRWRPDVAHVHDRAEPRLLACSPRVPTVVTVHDPIPHPGHPGPRSRLTRGVLDYGTRRWRRESTVIVVHGETLRQELLEVSRFADVRVIPHGIEVAASPTEPPRDPVIGFFGRMEHYKGVRV